MIFESKGPKSGADLGVVWGGKSGTPFGGDPQTSQRGN